MTDRPQALVTEEDAPTVRALIKKIKRLREREHSHGKTHYTELDDAIKSLIGYGELKDWWKNEE